MVVSSFKSTVITWVIFTDFINNSEMILSTIKGEGGRWLTNLIVRGIAVLKEQSSPLSVIVRFSEHFYGVCFYSHGVQSGLSKSSFEHTKLLLKTHASIFLFLKSMIILSLKQHKSSYF